jgi:hypothetical protein
VKSALQDKANKYSSQAGRVHDLPESGSDISTTEELLGRKDISTGGFFRDGKPLPW